MSNIKVKRIWTSDQLIPLFLEVLFFVTSSVVTIMLMVTIGNSLFSKIIMGTIGFGFATANGYYMAKALQDKPMPKRYRAGFIVISLSCFFVSILSTLAFGSGEVNIEQNKIKANNTIALMQQDEIKNDSNS
jgi:hydrogenase/urease accessory protein HupE